MLAMTSVLSKSVLCLVALECSATADCFFSRCGAPDVF
jgi:hypothetical protein